MVTGYRGEVVELMQTYYCGLREKERRHYAAVEAMKLGHGGVTYISQLLGIDRNTIIEGKKELQALASGKENPLSVGRQRRAGGGRKKKAAGGT
jgi:hypothetical protein